MSKTTPSRLRGSTIWVRLLGMDLNHAETCPTSATRIIAGWYFVHQDAGNYPTTNFDAFNPASEETNEHVDVQEDHYKVVREIGAASTVLLKNQNGALPLTKPRSIVLIGSDAGPGTVGPNGFADQVRLCIFARLFEFKRLIPF
jgi:beta-glucosidase-like glycosyl hydrolase